MSQSIARYLSGKNITPNQISVTSIAFAALAAFSLVVSGHADAPASLVLLLLAAVFIQMRLLCNLFDGMVAVEGGKSTPSGELFNDIPDRIADPMILVATGYGTGGMEWGVELGWLAGLVSVITAYVRTLSASIGAPVNFSGPMAKQHRMAVLTIACLVAVVESGLAGGRMALVAALFLIVAGGVLTAVRRTVAAYRYLES